MTAFRFLPAGLLLLSVAPAWAQPIYSQDFNNQNDAGLTHYDPLGGVPGGTPTSYTFPQLGPGNFGYRIQVPPSPNPGVFGPARAGAARADLILADFQASADLINWDNTTDQGFGIGARGRQLSIGQFDGYYLGYYTNGSLGSGININRIDDEVGTPITPPGQGTVTLTPGHGYRLVFTGTGPLLAGQVFDLADLSTPLATVSATDSTYTSGFTGLIANANQVSGPTAFADATFDNFAVSVPEPGSLALLAVVAVVGPVVSRWRRGVVAAVEHSLPDRTPFDRLRASAG